MKKIISIILIALMIIPSLLMMSCSGTDRGDNGEKPATDVKKEIKTAIDKMATLECCSGSSDLVIEAKSNGVTVTMEMRYKLKMSDLQTTNPKRYADVTVIAPGQSETGCVYTEGEWDYFVVGSEKYKTKVDEDHDVAFDSYSDTIYQNATVKKTGKGTDIKMTFTNDEIKQYFSSTLETVIDMFDLAGYESYITISDAYVRLLIQENGYAAEEELHFKLTVTVGGETVEIVFSNNGTYEKFNEPVTITPPKGYLSFKERLDGDII